MKKILFLIGFLVLLGLSLNAYAYNAKLDSAIKLMLKNDYYAALDECYRLERVLSGYDKAELFYVQGDCFIHLEDYEQARDVFKRGLRNSQGELSTKIYLAIADSYFMQHGFDKAIDIYKQLLAKNNIDYEAGILFKLGKSYQKKSKWTKSKYYFDQLKKKYPQSFEVSLVEKLSVGGNFFTVQVGCFSSKKNADKLRSDLIQKGYDVYVTPFDSNGSKLYRVRVGEFVSRIAAEHKESELKNNEHLPTHIFP